MSKATDMANRMTTRGKTYVPEYAADLLRQQDAVIRQLVEALEKIETGTACPYARFHANEALAAAKEVL